MQIVVYRFAIVYEVLLSVQQGLTAFLASMYVCVGLKQIKTGRKSDASSIPTLKEAWCQ